jgi:hypothetical protein
VLIYIFIFFVLHIMNTNLRDRLRKQQNGGGLRLAGQTINSMPDMVNTVNIPNTAVDNKRDIINNIRQSGRMRGRYVPRNVLGYNMRPGGFGSMKNWSDAYKAAEMGDYAPGLSEVAPYLGEIMMGLL